MACQALSLDSCFDSFLVHPFYVRECVSASVSMFPLLVVASGSEDNPTLTGYCNRLGLAARSYSESTLCTVTKEK